MKKLILILVGIVLIFFIGGFLFITFGKNIEINIPILGNISSVEMKPLQLNQEDISSITKPAIISIYNHMEGNATIPYFDIDWKTLELVFPTGEKPMEIPISDDIRGSGFVVSKDGYIVTNAHVVSSASYKQILALQFIGLRFISATKSTNEIKQLSATMKEKGIQDIDARQFGEDLGNALGDKLAEKIKLTITQKIVVLDPSSTGTKLSDLVSKGFPATIIDVNDNYLKDERDVAIIKIDKGNFSTLDLNISQKANIGNKIYVYGFPSTGQFNTNDALEPTFTQGTISGLKDSKLKIFQVIQTDAKVSPGSSGGPLLNEQGEVIGILTFASTSDVSGDTFAFAIPISLAKETLDKRVTISKSDFTGYMKNGLLYLQNNRCQKSTQNFDSAKILNYNSLVDKDIETYINLCKNITTSGKSIDTTFQEFKVKLSNLGGTYWLLAGLGVMVFIIIIFIIIKLLRRVKKNEQQMNNLKLENTEHNAPSDNPTNTNLENTSRGASQVTNNIEKVINPDLLKYIQSSQKAGVNNDTIITNLKNAGWEESEIIKTINYVKSYNL